MVAATKPKGKLPMGPRPRFNQAEKRHHSAAVGFSALDLQQGCNGGKESGLKATGEK